MKITNEIVKNLAANLGFDLVGFSASETLVNETEFLKNWIDKGFHAGMEYLERNIDKRYDANNILPGTKSIISLAANYYIDEQFSENTEKGKISRYAWGKDYHLILWEKLNLLISRLKTIDVDFKAKSFVDSGPVMDKVWAVKGGIGWMGKNSNVINRNIGSWFFIATVLTNYNFEYNIRAPDLCGSCTACIDACPTDAIVADFVVDANKCISYQTIENKGEIDQNLEGKFNGWIFGCDICQDVCPWNVKFAKQTETEEFLPVKKHKEFTLPEIEDMDEKAFKEMFNESPVKRAKLKGLKRNAEFVFAGKNKLKQNKDNIV